jgi:hypothetical protein
MSARSLLALLSLLSFVSVAGCKKDPTQVIPETRGKRGENCQARNDCQTGLACLNGICSKNEFDIDVAVKQCDRIDCEKTDDCCGGKPTKAPAKCNGRDEICKSAVDGCVASQVCTSDSVCGDGVCRPASNGSCSGGLSGACATVTDCRDVCSASGLCTRSSVSCVSDADCTYAIYNDVVTCVLPTRTCNCQNPNYNPADPICTDPDCENLCLLRCEAERCVTDKSCATNTDCTAFGLPLCNSGRCVECKTSKDCDDDETCEEGVCHKPCKHNEECPLFYECDADSGDCEYKGCHSDRECILAASRGSDPANPESMPSASGEDARLQKCLPSEADPDINTCKIPCENDGSCGAQSVCDKGYCKFIGCETDEECRAYLGIANQMPTDAKPFVSTAVCREAPTK